MLRLRAALFSAFRATYAEHDVIEVTSPCPVRTQVEGGSLDYYDHSRTSRKILTCIAERVSRLSVFYAQKSVCAENSHTLCHLSEHTRLEAELAFITIDDLMNHIDVSLRITIIFRMFRC